MSGYYSVDARDEAVQRERRKLLEQGRGVVVIDAREVAIDRDIRGRALDRHHDIDECNEYRPWHERKKRI